MANTDLFGRAQSTMGGAFSADDSLLSFTNVPGESASTVPLLLQDAAFTYSQQVSLLYDLTSENVYYVRGRAAGNGQLSQILGPTRLSSTFLRNYGSVCRAADNNMTLSMRADCTEDGQSTNAGWENTQSFTLQFVVLTQVSRQMSVQNMLIQQSMQLTYASMVENE